MFTVRCAANVLSQVTIICLSLRKVLFKFQQQQPPLTQFYSLLRDRSRALYDL